VLPGFACQSELDQATGKIVANPDMFRVDFEQRLMLPDGLAEPVTVFQRPRQNDAGGLAFTALPGFRFEQGDCPLHQSRFVSHRACAYEGGSVCEVDVIFR
jgi:hypothetical protein